MLPNTKRISPTSGVIFVKCEILSTIPIDEISNVGGIEIFTDFPVLSKP